MTTEQRQERLTDQLRRGQQEARDLGREIADIAMDLRTLAQKEVQLARAEVAEQAGLSVRSLIWGAAAALLAVLTLVFVFLTVMFVLDTFLPLWAAALITTGVLAVVTAIAGLIAYTRFKRISLTPQRTMQSLREDMRWARSQLTLSAK